MLVDDGAVRVAGASASAGQLVYVPPGRATLELTAGPDPVRLLLLGGPPFGESIVMWWNFVGRTHEEIVDHRARWQAQISDDGLRDGHYGTPTGDELPPIPAPEMPHVRLRERR